MSLAGHAIPYLYAIFVLIILLENILKIVSVLIPVEKYVKEAIQSIQNQTYKNLEIVVVDDGSIDNTYKIVEELAKEDNRIKLYKNKQNLKIVNYAKGEYILRMDGDDISTPDRIETL